jgi:pimeloyl-[acyl-carrier protein] methyl ester esterase
MEQYVTRIGSGPPLVALHGWGQTRAGLAPLAEALADRCTVVTLDLPGYGARRADPGPFDYARYADEVAAVVRATVGDEPFTLLGWSMGGSVAATYVKRRLLPLPARLVMLAATPRFTAPDRESVGVGQPKAAVVKMAKKMKADPEAGLSAFIALFFASGEAIADADRERIETALRDPATFPPSPAALLATLDELMDADLTEEPIRFAGPMLSLYGALDRIAPAGGQKLWDKVFADVVHHRLDGIGHAPHLTATTVVADRIARFVREGV